MKKIIIAGFFIVMYNGLIAQTKIGKEFYKGCKLPNFGIKVNNKNFKDTLNIAYFGGSITEQNDGWRDQSFAWFQNNFPRQNFKQIKAAIGGTGSLLGVFRYNKHVIENKPDLLFIEFAVNDLKETRESILENFDGIIQKTWRANSYTDICIVFSINQEMLVNYNSGELPPSIMAMQEIAKWYNIPTINYGINILKKINSNTLFIKGSNSSSQDSIFFSPDGVHPYPTTGHVYYTEVLTKYLPKLLSNKRNVIHNKAAYYSPKLVDAGSLDVINYLDANGLSSKPSIKFPDKITKLATNIISLNDTSQSVKFQFIGDRIGFMDIIGPSSASIDVYIDKEPVRHIERFDSYCSFNRIHWFYINGLSNGKHLIKIKLSNIQPNKSEIIGSNNPSLLNKEDYKKFEWSVSKILITDITSIVKL